MKQLTFEAVVGNLDYAACSTSEQLISSHLVTPTYAVDFFD